MTGQKTRIASVINLGPAIDNYRQTVISKVEIDQIIVIPGHNPRGFATGDQPFQGSDFEALKRSIQELGDVFQPILLRNKVNSNMFELVAGERRYRAAKELGLPVISAVVRDLTDDESYRLARQENELRTSVAKIDVLFSSLHQLASRLKLSVHELRALLIQARDAQALGKTLDEDSPQGQAVRQAAALNLPSVATLVRSSRLLDLTPAERQALREGLPEAAALALLNLGDHPQRAELLRRALQDKWTARQMETQIKALSDGERSTTQLQHLINETARQLRPKSLKKLSTDQQSQLECTLSEAVLKIRAILDTPKSLP